MDPAKKMEFVHRMTKLALQHVPHFDNGGTVQAQGAPVNPTAQAAPTTLQGSNSQATNTTSANPVDSLGGGVAATLGLASTYSAGGADVTPGTNTAQLQNSYDQTQQGIAGQQQLANTLQPQAQAGVNAQNQLSQQYSQEAQGLGPNVAVNQLNQATGTNTANQAALMASQRGSSANPGLIARQAAQTGAQNQQDAAGQAATLQAQQQIAAQQNQASLAANQIGQTGQAVTGLNQANQGEQGILQNANTSLNNANVGMQSNINTTNAQTAAANANGIGGLIGGGISAIGSVFSAFAEGGEVKKMASGGDPGSSANWMSSPDTRTMPQAAKDDETTRHNQDAADTQRYGAPTTQSVPMTDGMTMKAGQKTEYASGGKITGQTLQGAAPPTTQSFVGNWISSPTMATNGPNTQGAAISVPDTSKEQQNIASGVKNIANSNIWNSNTGESNDQAYTGASNSDTLGVGSLDSSASSEPDSLGVGSLSGSGGGSSMMGLGSLESDLAKGGKVKDKKKGKDVPAMVSPGEVYLSPEKVKLVLKGANPMRIGEHIGGKAPVKNDSYSNDIVPKKLKTGGIVIPRHITTHKNSDSKSMDFVRATIAKKGKGLKR